MLKVIVADDEFFIRYGLVDMIGQLFGNQAVVREACDGEELIALIETWQPDIVLTDIKMPKCTGLQAMEEIVHAYPHIKWLIISGYEDFQYAKQALQLGVCDYLVKPVGMKQLEQALEQMLHKLQHERAQTTKAFVQHVSNCLRGVERYKGTDTLLGTYVFLALDEQGVTWEAFKEQCMAALEGTTRHTLGIGLAYLGNQRYGLVVFAEHTKEEEAQEELLQLDQAIVHYLVNQQYKVRVMRTSLQTEYERIEQSVQQIEQFKHLHVLYAPSQVIEVEGIRGDAISTGMHRRLCDTIVGLTRSYTEGNRLNYAHYLEHVKELCNEPSLKLSSKQLQHITAYLTMQQMLEEGQQEATTTKQYLKELIAKLEVVKWKEGKRETKTISDEICAYIEAHYSEDIGIHVLAEKFELSPNYISSLFKSARGITFMKYLTEVRMKEARHLLLTETSSVGQVAQQVGYHESGYFTKVFKEYYGESPARFIKNNR